MLTAENLRYHLNMVLWQKWCCIASMESLIFYLVLLAPLLVHSAVKPASFEEELRNQEEVQEFGKLLWESYLNRLNKEIRVQTAKYTGFLNGDLNMGYFDVWVQSSFLFLFWLSYDCLC